jgi:hypothetical protein
LGVVHLDLVGLRRNRLWPGQPQDHQNWEPAREHVRGKATTLYGRDNPDRIPGNNISGLLSNAVESARCLNRADIKGPWLEMRGSVATMIQHCWSPADAKSES